jgi:hypothetical protein
MGNEQERDTNERETFRRCRTVVESQDRPAIDDFFRRAKDEVGRQPDDGRDPAAETSAGHADRIERAKEGL